MSIEVWLVYFLAAIGLSLTPGPNGLLALTHGANYGLPPTINTILGGALGFFLLIAASLAGMGALLAASERAFTFAKFIGAGYLIFLGVRLWRAPGISITDVFNSARVGHPRPSRLFGEGLFVAVSNPKGIIFFAAFLPQFMVPGMSFLMQLAVFGGTFVIVETAYELALAGLAQRIAPWLSRWGRWFNRATGAAFIGIGALLTTASR